MCECVCVRVWIGQKSPIQPEMEHFAFGIEIYVQSETTEMVLN